MSFHLVKDTGQEFGNIRPEEKVADDRRAAKPLPWNSETADSISSTAMNDSEYDPHPAVEVAGW